MPNLKMFRLSLDQEPATREKTLFGIALVIVFVFAYNYVLAPKSKTVALLRGDLKGAESEKDAIQGLLEATAAQLAKEQQAGPRVVGFDPWVERVLKRRVADPVEEVSTTVDQLRSRKIARRVKISDVTLGNSMKEEGLEVVPITVLLNGSYSAIRGYIASLERMERPVLIKSFDIKSDERTPGQLRAKVLLHLYLMKRG
jgi:Tfp pilus assembly protein PilO